MNIRKSSIEGMKTWIILLEKFNHAHTFELFFIFSED
jgi:hypothetical protein